MRHITLAWALVACQTPADGDTFGPPQGAPPTTGEVAGRVVDEAAEPVVGAAVSLCSIECAEVETGADGAFAFEPLPTGPYLYRVTPPEGSDLAEPLVPIQVAASTPLDLQTVLPTLDAPVALPDTPAEREVASGLFLTVALGDLEGPDGAALTEIAGALVPSSAWPPLSVAGEVVAVWYLAPAGASSVDSLGVPIQLTNDYDLEEGETYALWGVDATQQALVKIRDLTVTPTHLANPSARLTSFTTLVLVEPDTVGSPDPPDGPYDY